MTPRDVLNVRTLLMVAAALAGCERPVYTVVEQLPDPPAPPARSAPVASVPPAEAVVESLDAASPPGWAPPTRETPWRYIVIHHSATDTGDAAEFDRMHREVRGWDELGYHFVITNGRGGPDGAVEVGSRWTKQKWGAHTGGTPDNEYNEYGVGVCLVGNTDDAPPTEAQLASLAELVAFLRARYGIPPRHVLGHCEAPNAATGCPGRLLRAYIARTFRAGAGEAAETAAGPAPADRRGAGDL